MASLIWFLAGVAAGATCWQLFGAKALTFAARRWPGMVADVGAVVVVRGPCLAARVDAAIAELEAQIRSGIDVDRNGTRLAQLREVRGE